jgi:hypothetical protein
MKATKSTGGKEGFLAYSNETEDFSALTTGLNINLPQIGRDEAEQFEFDAPTQM